MSGERNQNLVKLFHLVSSLSKKEKQQFWSYIQGNARKVTGEKYIRLFERLAKDKTLKSRHIQKEIFSNDSKALNDSCRYLVQKILESLALNSNSTRMGLVMVDQAIERGFVKLASRLLRQELQYAANQHDMVYLKETYERVRRLKKHYNEEVKANDQIPSWEQVLNENYALAKSDMLYQRFVKAFPPGSEQAKEVHEDSKPEINQLFSAIYSPKTQARVLRTMSLWAVLNQNDKDAAGYHQNLIRLQSINPGLFSQEQRIEELRIYITLCMHLGQYDMAESSLTELGSIETQSELFERMVSQTWIQTALTLAAYGGKLEIGKVALKKFQQEIQIYKPFTRAYLTHVAIMVAISFENWELAHELLRKLARTRNLLEEGYLQVEPAIRAVVNFQLGNTPEAISDWEKLHEIAEKSPRKYLGVVSNIIETVVCREGSQMSKKLILNTQSEKLEQILQNEEERFHAQFFNVESWLRSQITGRRIKDLIQEGSAPGLMAMRLSS